MPEEIVTLAVGFRGHTSEVRDMAHHHGATHRQTQVPLLHEIKVPAGAVAELVRKLKAHPDIVYVSRAKKMTKFLAPNDPYYTNGTEWHLNGTWGCNMEPAWDITTGSYATIVGDVDTGLDYNHLDMYQNVWLNQPEIPASILPNLTDVDGDGIISFYDLNQSVNIGSGKIIDVNADGIISAADVLSPTANGGWASGSVQDSDIYPDDLCGWNFVSNNLTPLDDNTYLGGPGHGTFTGGEIGAMTNNSVGISGVCWKVSLMPVKGLNSLGSGDDITLAECMVYAVNHGAKVINCSWGGYGTSNPVAEAISYAAAYEALVVCSAGNGNGYFATDNSNPYYFVTPASYTSQFNNIMSVAAITETGQKANYSNYGVGPNGPVQLGAPGGAGDSTSPDVYGLHAGDNGYEYLAGTSMAAPLVSGVAALLYTLHPTAQACQIRNMILSTVRFNASLSGLVTTGGILDAGAALAVATPEQCENPYGPLSLPCALVGISQYMIHNDLVDKAIRTIGPRHRSLLVPTIESGQPLLPRPPAESRKELLARIGLRGEPPATPKAIVRLPRKSLVGLNLDYNDPLSR